MTTKEGMVNKKHMGRLALVKPWENRYFHLGDGQMGKRRNPAPLQKTTTSYPHTTHTAERYGEEYERYYRFEHDIPEPIHYRIILSYEGAFHTVLHTLILLIPHTQHTMHKGVFILSYSYSHRKERERFTYYQNTTTSTPTNRAQANRPSK